MKRTSLTHPLQIAAISAGCGFGSVGVTFCPGKYHPNAMSRHWKRDLELDLDAIRDWGAAAVLTLLEHDELAELWVERLGDAVRLRAMAWFHAPIVDGSIPNERFEQQWAGVGAELRSILRSGRNVLIHCKGGLGRAGTIAARLLIELGMPPEIAIERVRSARPDAIETRGQEQFLFGIGALTKINPARDHPWTGSKSSQGFAKWIMRAPAPG